MCVSVDHLFGHSLAETVIRPCVEHSAGGLGLRLKPHLTHTHTHIEHEIRETPVRVSDNGRVLCLTVECDTTFRGTMGKTHTRATHDELSCATLCFHCFESFHPNRRRNMTLYSIAKCTLS